MPVDIIHATIGLLFLTLWGVISLFAFGHNDTPGSPQTGHSQSTATPRGK
jgi:hypothetical protein